MTISVGAVKNGIAISYSIEHGDIELDYNIRISKKYFEEFKKFLKVAPTAGFGINYEKVKLGDTYAYIFADPSIKRYVLEFKTAKVSTPKLELNVTNLNKLIAECLNAIEEYNVKV